jgi:diketogulonate reductase-like aldo/keto reductase
MKDALSLPGSPIRRIGVSNFTIHHLQDIDPGIPIYCNQFELHPLLYLDNDTQKLIAACSEKGIRVQAYSSLGQSNFFQV